MSIPPIRVRPADAVLGASVQGVDVRALDSETFAAIHRAWLEHQVLLFQDQDLSDEDLVAFSRRFGDLDEAPVQETGQRFVEGHPEIYVISNVVQDGLAIGSLGSGEAVWHTDMSYLPDRDALPERLRRRVDGLRVKHDGTYNSGGYTRQGVTPTDDPRTSPGTFHPLVYGHPETGRRALYLGRRRNAYIEGLSLDESNTLLDDVWAEATRESLTWRHRWRVGDLVLWDNRCTMHRRDAFDAAARRVMHRTQIKADRSSRAG
jgi:taurine dioxygenase